MSKKAYDLVTIDLSYERPPFVFPELNSPEGNPMEYFKIAQDTLKKYGFRKEAQELDSLKKSKYEEHFNIIARFLDFSNSKETLEDDEYIYVKIKKNNQATEQLREIFSQSPQQIQELINENYDFSKVNCYGRNHLHYINDCDSLKLLLEHNEEKNWFELFDLDNFNSTILHGKDIHSMSIILDKMNRESKEMTKVFFYGTNVFGRNAFGDFLNYCDTYFNKLKFFDDEGNDKNLSSIASIIANIGKFDSKKKDELLGIFIKLDTDSEKNMYKRIQRYVLEHELNDAGNKTQPKKMKI